MLSEFRLNEIVQSVETHQSAKIIKITETSQTDRTNRSQEKPLMVLIMFALLTTLVGCQSVSTPQKNALQTHSTPTLLPPLAVASDTSLTPSISTNPNHHNYIDPEKLADINKAKNTQSTKPSPRSLDTASAVSIQNGLVREDLRHEYRLDNGLKVIIKEDHRAPVVMTQVWYHVGSTDEPDGLGGISHLLEHMMFKGTNKVSGMDFDRLMAKFGGDQNAFTSHDYTGYYELLPANRLAVALELEADRMVNLNFDSADFISEFVQEREVVIEERRQRTDDNPIARSFETFRMMALPDSPKGRSVIGPIADIENIEIADLKNWYNTWYTPNNATLVIVGDVNPDEAMAQVTRYFADLPYQKVPNRPSLSQKGWRGFQQETLYEAVNIPTLLMAFNVPTLPSITHTNTAATQAELTFSSVLKSSSSELKPAKQDVYDLLLLQYILDGGYAARFESRLVRQQELLASIVSYYDPYERGDGLFLIQATPNEGVTLEEAQEAILQEISNFKYEYISDDEIERARSNLLKGFVFSQDSVSSQAYMIGSMQARGLDERLIEQLPQQLIKSNQEQIQAITNKYFVDDNLTILHIQPY